MNNQFLKCLACKKISPNNSIQCIFCKGVYSLLLVNYSHENKVKNIKDLYKYFLPFKLFKENNFKNCSLNQYSDNIWIKNEGENKSKSIKEKDIFIGLKAAEYFKYKKTCLVSGGSGIGVAKYFVDKYNVPLTLYSPLKTNQKLSNQIKIGKDYEDTFRYVIKHNPKDSFNITPGINPYSQEGAKTISWQLMSSEVIFDVIVVPCGNGSILWSLYKGFKEAFEQKLIKKIPALYSVELKNGPVKKALKTGKIEKNKSILGSKATSIDVKESFCIQKAIFAIKQSGGDVGFVTEKEIENVYKELHKKGITSLFTAAVSLAMAQKLRKKFSQKKICAVLTGSE